MFQIICNTREISFVAKVLRTQAHPSHAMKLRRENRRRFAGIVAKDGRDKFMAMVRTAFKIRICPIGFDSTKMHMIGETKISTTDTVSRRDSLAASPAPATGSLEIEPGAPVDRDGKGSYGTDHLCQRN